jgi:hypothetical protein
MRQAGRDERLRCSAALLLYFAAGLQLQMRLTGVMRWGCPVTREEFECDATYCKPNSPVCLSRCIQHALPYRAEHWHI